MRTLIAAASAALLAAGGVALAQAPAAKAPTAQTPAPKAGGVQPAPGYRPPIQTSDKPQPSYLPIKDFMRHVVNPAAEAYWAHSGYDDDDSKAPRSEALWQEQYDHAAAIQEAGNLLLAEGRRLDDPVWIKNANKLIQGGQEGIKASAAKDAEAGFNAGSTMYEACYDCHGKYVVRPKNSLYGRDVNIPKPDGDTHSLR